MKLFIKRVSFCQVLSLLPVLLFLFLSLSLSLFPSLSSLPLSAFAAVSLSVCVCVCLLVCRSPSAPLFLSSLTLYTHFWTPLTCVKGFPVVKNLPANAGDIGSIPRLGGSLEEGMATCSSILV